MPIFEFQCKTCSNTFEELIRNQTQINQVNCPECHSTDLDKLMSLFGFSGDVDKSVSSSSGTISCSSCTSKNCSSCH